MSLCETKWSKTHEVIPISFSVSDSKYLYLPVEDMLVHRKLASTEGQPHGTKSSMLDHKLHSATSTKKRTRASQAWLFSVLDVSVLARNLGRFGFRQFIAFRTNLANSLKHNSSKVMFTKRKLYRNNCGNDSFLVPSWVYRHQ